MSTGGGYNHNDHNRFHHSASSSAKLLTRPCHDIITPTTTQQQYQNNFGGSISDDGGGRSSRSSSSAVSGYGPSFDMNACTAEHTETTGQISWIMAAFLLINAALGAGLLNYPVAYDRLGGVACATIIQVFAVFLMATTMLALVHCAYEQRLSSYHDVMRVMCGRRVMQMTATSIAITCFGICITFVIIIGDQFDRIFATYIGPNFCTIWYVNRSFTMAAVAVGTIWPLCYFRRLDFLRHVNIIGVIASFYLIFLNVYSYYTLDTSGGHRMNPDQPLVHPSMRTSPESLMKFIAALPVVFFAYQTHEIVIPVHQSMADKSLRSFTKSTVVALASLLVLYCLAGTYGYMTFGSNVAPDVMLMYDAHDPVVVAGIVALVIKMITTYPPVLFCGRDTIVRIISQALSETSSVASNGTSISPTPFKVNSVNVLKRLCFKCFLSTTAPPCTRQWKPLTPSPIGHCQIDAKSSASAPHSHNNLVERGSSFACSGHAQHHHCHRVSWLTGLVQCVCIPRSRSGIAGKKTLPRSILHFHTERRSGWRQCFQQWSGSSNLIRFL